jgi:glycosyltransferase involved in cell wall biosynthesis
VTPGKVPELTAALQTLIENEPLRLRLGRQARMRAENFDVERYSVDLARIYRRLLTPGR